MFNLFSSKKKILVGLLIALIFCFSAFAQEENSDTILSTIEKVENYMFYRNFDSTFIKSYEDKINVHLLAANKYSLFQVRDKQLNSNLMYRPELGLMLGAGIAYKWISFDLAFSSWIKEESVLSNSDFMDFQVRIFSSKQFIESTFQYYYGYKLSSISSHYDEIPENFKARDDMRSIHLNLQYLYVFNYTKYSIQAPYTYNQAQRKSAGSPVVGAAFTMYVFDADSSIVPTNLEPNFNSSLYLNDFNNIGISINVGYMHTFVVKKRFYYNIGLIPGLDLNKGDFLTENRHRMDPNLSFRIRFMNALGYSGTKYYCGVQFIGNVFSAYLDKKQQANIGYTKIGLAFGYRF